MKTSNMNTDKNDIKKLNLNDLNEINGGFSSEVEYDSIYLENLGLLNDSFGDIYILFHWEEATSYVEDGWAKVGITCVTSYFSCNYYYYQGKMISRDDALEIAKKSCIKGPQIGPGVL